MSNNLKDIFGENIYSYTREMAITDGVLIDISDFAKEAGFKIPVAVTNTIYSEYLAPTEEEKEFGQSLNGRLWDMLMIIYFAARSSNSNTLHLSMSIMFENETKDVDFKVVIGPGDTPDPVLTIMQMDED